MNKDFRRAEKRMLVVSLAGMIGIGLMSVLEYVRGNTLISAFSLALLASAAVNLLVYKRKKNLVVANAVMGAVGGIAAILGTVWGGYAKMGWLAAMVFVPLAYGSFQLLWGLVANLLLMSVIGSLLTWGYYHGWPLGYSVQEYLIFAFVYIILACISGAARWELENLLKDEQNNLKIRVLQAKELQRFEAAAEQSIEMMVFTDPEGIILWANKAAETITGFTIKEATGLKAGVLWGKLMPKAWYQKMWQTIKEEKKTFRAEIENHRKNGEHFFSTITVYPMLGEKNEVEYFVATQRDITKEKQIDQMKTDFISLASHQLRTPLSSMRWNLEMLKSGDLGKLAPKQQKVLTNIYASNQNMIEIVGQLLNISHLESGKMTIEWGEEKIGSLIATAIKDSEVKLKRRKQKLAIKLEERESLINTDLKLLAQVISNLVNNAVKYSPEEATITIAGQVEEKEYKVSVIDKGIGIPNSEHGRIFGKYYRASNATKVQATGTGLGLYLCAFIIKLLGGKIGFESKVGEGSTFWFTVPYKPAKPKQGERNL